MNAVARMLVFLVLAHTPAVMAAEGTPSWPPSPEVRSRMGELQAVISDPASGPQARSDARTELRRLLGSPSAPARPEPEGEEALPKARTPLAVAPALSLPAPRSSPSTRDSDPPVAHVVPAPRAIPPFIDPQTGRTLIPSGQVAIDPATGRALPQVPGGYVDPGSGRVVRPR